MALYFLKLTIMPNTWSPLYQSCFHTLAMLLLFAIIQVEAAKIGSEAEVRKLLDEGEDPDSHEDNKVHGTHCQ